MAHVFWRELVGWAPVALTKAVAPIRLLYVCWNVWSRRLGNYSETLGTLTPGLSVPISGRRRLYLSELPGMPGVG